MLKFGYSQVELLPPQSLCWSHKAVFVEQIGPNWAYLTLLGLLSSTVTSQNTRSARPKRRELFNYQRIYISGSDIQVACQGRQQQNHTVNKKNIYFNTQYYTSTLIDNYVQIQQWYALISINFLLPSFS